GQDFRRCGRGGWAWVSTSILIFWATQALATPVSEIGTLERPINLAGVWTMSPGDDLAWADPDYDDSAWRQVTVPKGIHQRDRAEWAWYRKTLRVAAAAEPLALEERAALRLGVTIGKVDSAYEIYVGGRRLGGIGGLPPTPRMEYDRHAIYEIPASAVTPDGRLVVALRVWKSSETAGDIDGPYGGPFLLGRMQDLVRRELRAEHPQLFLAGLFLITALFHLELFRRRPQLQGYLWFSICAAAFAAYSVLGTQWKYNLSENFLLLKEIEYLLLFVLVAVFIQLVWPLLGLRIGPALRAYQMGNLAAGLGVALTPGLALNIRLLPFWELSLLPLAIYGLWSIFRQAWRKNPQARIIGVGTAAAAVVFAYDIAVDRGFVVGPRLISVGFAILVLSLATSLANQFILTHRELANLRRDLEQRVEERTRQLLEASQEKTRFLANMSHEIRTPLNGVIGVADLLLATKLTSEQQEYVEIARSSGDAVLSLIDDILDFSKIEAGKIALEHRPFSLRDTLQESVGTVALKAAEKRLDLAIVVDPLLPAKVLGDDLRVRQILVNLIGNAVKFTAKGGVLVNVDWRGNRAVGAGQAGETTPSNPVGEVHLRVVDTGIGIPKNRLDRLFKLFSQVDASNTRRYGGSGLGLAISHRLCELMGGKLWADSEEGRGSTFHFTFPAEAVAGPREALAEPEASELRERSILVVEDGVFTRQMLLETLTSWGVSVQLAESPEEALHSLRSRQAIQAAIVSGEMASDDGRVARAIRSELDRQQIPWIATRRLGAHEPAATVIDCGPTERIGCPIQPAELLQTLVTILGTPSAMIRVRQKISDGGDPERRIQLRILLAEDDPINQIVTRRMLEHLQCRADLAATGVEALEALELETYDVVFLDVQMPELDGLATVRRIRQRWPRPAGPWVVALTANAVSSDREKCLAAGMDDYVSKPVRAKDLRSALERYDAAQTFAPAEIGTPPRPGGSPLVDAQSSIVDLETLLGLQALDGGEGRILCETIDLFLEGTSERIEALTTALAAEDLAALELVAHSLKSAAGTLGGRSLMRTCAELEDAARSGALLEAAALVAAVGRQMAVFAAELEPFASTDSYRSA
ncbi:MAG: response regulator, partial [Acidobacteriota bacterium]